MASYSVDKSGDLIRKGAFLVSSNDPVGAINESIKKWRAIHRRAAIDGLLVRSAGSHCALCVCFKDDKRTYDPCQDCPVQAMTDEPECRGTPFWKYPKYRAKPSVVLVVRAERAAAAEVLFLQAVRAFLTG